MSDYQSSKERHEEARRRWPGALGGASNLVIREVPEVGQGSLPQTVTTGQWSPAKDANPVKTESPEPGSAQWRKQRPLYSGVLAYFPDALLEVAHASWKGSQQHQPGQPTQWDKSKSTDEPDALLRHLRDRAAGEKFDTDGVRHLAKVAWRALANLQRELDAEKSLKQLSTEAGTVLAYHYEPGKLPPTSPEDPRIIPLKNRRDPAA